METIYDCLSSIFWTNRKCWKCQKQFTISDYQIKNYYLTFQEILEVWESKEFPEPRDNACFDGVIVRLFHQQCSLFKSSSNECQVEVVKDIICPIENNE